jgi:hypothetical protein
MKKKKVKKIISSKNQIFDNIIAALFILGLILLVGEILIYRKTIIGLKIPLLIFLVPGFILTPIFYKKLNEIDNGIDNYHCIIKCFLHYVLHSCMTGGILVFLFMATNFYFADKNITTRRFEIIRIDSLPGSKGHRSERKPYVVINYDGMEKELIFTYSETEQVKIAKFVTLEVKKGLLGFDVLENYEVE